MIRDFESWSNLVEVSQLEELKDVRIGIEASDFLRQRILNHPRNKEPLVPALGGLPLAFNEHISNDLRRFQSLGATPFFVFSGLDIAKHDNLTQQRREGADTNAAAWALYDQHFAEKAVERFGESTYVVPEDLFRALQAILVEHKLPFMVAPYSAWAQLVYLEKQGDVQVISGSSELLLFDSNKIVTSWNLEADQFGWIKRDACVTELRKAVSNADIADDTFVDACLLAGSLFLPTLPTLANNRNKHSKLHGAIEMIMSQGRTGISVVQNVQDDPRIKNTNYLDRYRRARLAVKHHPVLLKEGKVEPLVSGQLPNDPHEIIGQRLPDEVLLYMSRGLINSRILTWRVTSEIIEAPPMDGGESEEYRNLVSTKLTPLRTTAINLLSSSLHNWYQHKDIELTCWFKNEKSTISMKNLPEWRKVVETWNVKEATFKDVVSKTQSYGQLGSAVLALENADFVSKSVSKKDVNEPLTTVNEILMNSIWRFLALRDYVDAEHSLTSWGKVLAKAISALKGRPELEEAAIVAVELIRLGVMNWDEKMFPYQGAPMRGEGARDKQFNLLISRVAGLYNLQHSPLGFTGPLSQHLLGFSSIINVVREALRDLVEVAATHLFMGGFTSRDVSILSDIAIRLPFLVPNNCALSIAVKSYLDELFNDAEPISAQNKARVREMASTRYFPQSINLGEDLNSAFALWDAVYDGVKNSGSNMKESEKKQWADANEWLSVRR